ncbi:glycosyltransferase family protein [Empedobacter stercoris]|uniref:hypothetical protein n=1 Tax=Empedobacter stercoris TaxID=1628248 RepID=UPI001CE1B61B|nr:hypothetical protein [Empedobacter stercoris]MCA4777328.1 hypothetical protein [Empedobacter stercoris]
MILYRYIINFICLFVPSKVRREKRKNYLQRPHIFIKNLQSIKSYKEFKNSLVQEKSILIVEPNPYHYELQPGYCKYFQDLGYNVDVIAQPNLRKDFVFQYYPNIPNIYYLSLKYQKKALQFLKIKEYDFVFFSTSTISSDNLRTSYINWLGFEPKTKFGILMVEHNVVPFVEDYGHEKYIKQKRSFTLAGQYNIPMLNPHYFGEIRLMTKSDDNIFAVVGNVKENVELLFEACRCLIKQNITNFKIIIVGRSVVSIIPEDLQQYIEVTGFINFKDLWQVYNKADFLMPMLNPEINNQLRFKDGSVTGSWQTIMGFLKPALINQDFKEYYRFNEKNALIYESNSQLFKVMNEAINMNIEEYKSIQESIRELAGSVYDESLNNLNLSVKYLENINQTI